MALGDRSVFHIEKESTNTKVILETLTEPLQQGHCGPKIYP